MKNKLTLAFALFTLNLLAQLVPHAYEFNVDNFPEVYGGKVEWKRFLHDHLVYPADELKKKTEGLVRINFVVTDKGKGVQPKVVRSLSPSLDKEALRLFNMLEWVPSNQGDKTVSVEHSLEIKFSASKYRKWVKERGFEKQAYTDLPADTSFAVYENVDKGASFDNKDKTFPEFVYSTLEYPEIARLQNLEGNIVMNFIIEPDGRVSNIRITKGVGGGCNEEATRLIGLTKWKPAQKNGMYVRYRMYYTMLFSLKNSFKDNSSGSQRSWGQ